MLAPGMLQQVRDTGIVERAIALRVTSIEEANGKLKCQFSDGKENMPGVITSQVSCAWVLQVSYLLGQEKKSTTTQTQLFHSIF